MILYLLFASVAGGFTVWAANQPGTARKFLFAQDCVVVGWSGLEAGFTRSLPLIGHRSADRIRLEESKSV